MAALSAPPIIGLAEYQTYDRANRIAAPNV
jgi:hypothetical protein